MGLVNINRTRLGSRNIITQRDGEHNLEAGQMIHPLRKIIRRKIGFGIFDARLNQMRALLEFVTFSSHYLMLMDCKMIVSFPHSTHMNT